MNVSNRKDALLGIKDISGGEGKRIKLETQSERKDSAWQSAANLLGIVRTTATQKKSSTFESAPLGDVGLLSRLFFPVAQRKCRFDPGSRR
jgi:hypothetical protein